MHFDTGTVIAVAAALIFYLRLMVIQRQRAKAAHGKRSPQSWIEIRNKYLVGLGVLLLVAGAVMASLPALAAVQPAWWVAVTLGIFLMGLGIG